MREKPNGRSSCVFFHRSVSDGSKRKRRYLFRDKNCRCRSFLSRELEGGVVTANSRHLHGRFDNARLARVAIHALDTTRLRVYIDTYTRTPVYIDSTSPRGTNLLADTYWKDTGEE